jgi:hypothetical protein
LSYSSRIAELLTGQLNKFVTLNRHQLAGQAANLDFWLLEVRHCLAVIDGYRERFERMRTAQENHVQGHATAEFPLNINLQDRERDLEPFKRPEQLRPVNDKKLRQSRGDLCEATYRFLLRCCNQGLISEAVLRASCESLEI